MQMNTKQACDMSHYPYPGSNFGKNSNWNDVLNSYPHVHGSPVLWKLGNTNYNLYIWPEEDYLKLYHFDGHTFSTNPTGSSGPLAAAMMSMPGGVLSLSWDGANTGSGVIWVSRPNPENPRIIGGPSIDVFSGHNQQHFAYRTVDGAIRDNFYCPECSGAQWRFQQINCNKNSNCVDKSSTALSKGPVATGGPFISTYSEHNQQHFTYLDAEGGIQDVFYCPDCSGEKWVVQQINQPGLTDAPAAVAAPFVSVFSGHDQQHFAFRTLDGGIWDSFYCPGCSGAKWRLQEISTSCIYAPSDQNDLTPNDAPCNAINKIVHGYLQAFNALPDQHGVLSELWNSEENPNDRVEWFAKESPPTIAGGKVFVAEFPAKPANSHWNTNNSSGRLIVYGQVNRN